MNNRALPREPLYLLIDPDGKIQGFSVDNGRPTARSFLDPVPEGWLVVRVRPKPMNHGPFAFCGTCGHSIDTGGSCSLNCTGGDARFEPCSCTGCSAPEHPPCAGGCGSFGVHECAGGLFLCSKCLASC